MNEYRAPATTYEEDAEEVHILPREIRRVQRMIENDEEMFADPEVAELFSPAELELQRTMLARHRADLAFFTARLEAARARLLGRMSLAQRAARWLSSTTAYTTEYGSAIPPALLVDDGFASMIERPRNLPPSLNPALRAARDVDPRWEVWGGVQPIDRNYIPPGWVGAAPYVRPNVSDYWEHSQARAYPPQ